MHTIQEYEAATEGAYDRAGIRYDLDTDAINREVAYPRLIQLLIETTGPLKDKRILDVGCGSGRLMRALIEAGAQAEGIELSGSSVTRARRYGLNVTQGSMLALPYPDGAFDMVVSYHSFNYLPSEAHAAALAEQSRVLASDGVLLLGMFPAETDAPPVAEILQNGERFVVFPRTTASIRALLADLGFCVLRTDSPILLPKEHALLPTHLQDAVPRERPYVSYVIGRKK